MSEHMSPIPSRLYNAAVGGHVAGADQIIDDETGLTLDKVAGSVLQEKEYTSGSNNGMGRVVLRKNLIEGVNTLTQAMINKSNTIYIIQYNFTLASDITIPANCVLEFDGGSISGEHTITGNNTDVKAGLVKIFSTDITFAGTWNVKDVYPEWFGAKGDFTDDASIAIQKALDLGAGKTVVLKHGNVFKISQTLYVRSNTEVIFDATLKNRMSTVPEAPCLQLTSSNQQSDETYGYTGVHDVYIHGNGLYDGNGNGNVTVASCLRMYHAKNIRVEGISFIGWKQYHCIEMGGCKNVHFKNLNFKGGVLEQGRIGEVIQLESCTDPVTAGGSYPYDGTKCNNVTIDSCIFEHEDGYYIFNSIGSHDGNTPNYQENIKIVNNIFRYNGPQNVDGKYGCINFDYKFKNVVIENNIIYDYGCGIILFNDVTNISVINNTFSDIYGLGIRLNIVNSNNSLVDIKNNKFFNCNLQNRIQSNTNCPCIYITNFSGYGFIKNNYFALDDNEWSVPFYINDAARNSKLVFQDNYIHGVAEARAEVKTVIQNILVKMGSSNIQTLLTDQTKYSMFYDSALS